MDKKQQIKNYKNSGKMFAWIWKEYKEKKDNNKQRICKKCKCRSPIEDPCNCKAWFYYK